MCKLDFKAIFASIVRFRESIPNKSSCQTVESLE